MSIMRIHRFEHSRARFAARALPVLLVAFIGSPNAAAQTRWHVNAMAAPGGDGLAWGTAFQSLDDALVLAGIDDEVWVARGVYFPSIEQTPGDPRSATFAVPPAVSMFGGFDGTETSLDDRAGLFDQTILTGDLGVFGSPYDNAYHVVYVFYPSGIPPGPVVIDGFTIRDGVGNVAPNRRGGGIYSFNSSLKLARCTITSNAAWRGGALYAQLGNLKLKWCSLTDNRAGDDGGALWTEIINVKVANSIFARNSAGARGGAVFVRTTADSVPQSPTVLFETCLFHDNYSIRGGAAFLTGNSIVAGNGSWSNCTFAYNSAESGGAIFAATNVVVPARTYLENCILWDNLAAQGPQIQGRVNVSYSIVQSGGHGPTNLALDPLFVNGPARDFRLLPGSPAIDSGSNPLLHTDYTDVDDNGTAVGQKHPMELGGGRRKLDDPATPNTGVGMGRIVDRGAYEY